MDDSMLSLLINERFDRLERLIQQPRIEQEFLSISDAATVLGLLSPKLIRKAIKRGELPCYNMGGRRATNRIPRRDFDAWVQAKRVNRGPSKDARRALVDKFFPTKKAAAA